MSTGRDAREGWNDGRALSTGSLLPLPVRVTRVRRETADVATFELTAASPFAFASGQFNMLYVFGLGEVAISISGDPARDDRIVHTVRAVGAVSSALARLRRDRVIGVRGPYGSYWPVAESEGSDIIIVAGGLGLAPLRPVIYHVLAHRERYGSVVVLYGARSPADILYRRELEAWRRRLDVDIVVTVDHAAADWRGNVGVVPALIPRTPVDPDHAVAMVCGPEIMMRFTVDALRQRGLAMDRIFLSMERNMKCAIGLCGHCQFGPAFICRDGPVFRCDRVASLFDIREI
jgi:NAD(P)H-flavin reductase